MQNLVQNRNLIRTVGTEIETLIRIEYENVGKMRTNLEQDQKATTVFVVKEFVMIDGIKAIGKSRRIRAAIFPLSTELIMVL